MSQTFTESQQAVIARVEGELLSGRTFRLVEQANRSVPLGGPPIPSRDWANIMLAIATFARDGDRSADVASKLFGRVSQWVTPNEVIAQVAAVLAEVVREGWHDTRQATGPEAGRPSSHEHPTTLRDALRLALLMTEVEMSAGWIGHAPGLGWVVAHLIERENITVYPHVFPKVAAQITARAAS